MTETDAKSVEHTRFVRELRKLLPAGLLLLIAIEALARGLWDTFITRFMPTNAPRGDVGRFTNADIAEGVGWHGDADQFVEALISAGRLARDPEFRLVVVDWHRLAPAYLRSNVKHAGGFIVPGAARNDERNGSCNGDRNEEHSDTTNGGLRPPVLSSLSSPSLSSPTSWGEAVREEVEVELLNCDVRFPSKAIANAIGHGCSPADVMALVAHWRCKHPAWDGGDLFNRIAVLRPGQDHTSLWRSPSVAYQKTVASNAATKVVDEIKADNAGRRERNAAVDERRAELQRLHWPAIERMSEESLRELYEAAFASNAAIEWGLRRDRGGAIWKAQQVGLLDAYHRQLASEGAVA